MTATPSAPPTWRKAPLVPPPTPVCPTGKRAHHRVRRRRDDQPGAEAERAMPASCRRRSCRDRDARDCHRPPAMAAGRRRRQPRTELRTSSADSGATRAIAPAAGSIRSPPEAVCSRAGTAGTGSGRRARRPGRTWSGRHAHDRTEKLRSGKKLELEHRMRAAALPPANRQDHEPAVPVTRTRADDQPCSGASMIAHSTAPGRRSRAAAPTGRGARRTGSSSRAPAAARRRTRRRLSGR